MNAQYFDQRLNNVAHENEINYRLFEKISTVDEQKEIKKTELEYSIDPAVNTKSDAVNLLRLLTAQVESTPAQDFLEMRVSHSGRVIVKIRTSPQQELKRILDNWKDQVKLRREQNEN